jgi:hypothetical protein
MRTRSNDPREIEREIDETRRRIDATIDELEHRLSPGRLFDMSTNYVRSHGGEMLENLEGAVRNNPVPFLLTGIGLSWMMATGATGEKPHHPRGRAREKAAEAGARASAAADAASGKLSAASSAAGAAAERARGSADAAGSWMRGTGDDATRMFSRLMQEQPMLMGGLAMLLGSALGASLPSTEWEDATLGATRDRIAGAAQRAGRTAAQEAARGAGVETDRPGAAPTAPERPIDH